MDKYPDWATLHAALLKVKAKQGRGFVADLGRACDLTTEQASAYFRPTAPEPNFTRGKAMERYLREIS